MAEQAEKLARNSAIAAHVEQVKDRGRSWKVRNVT